MTSTDATDLGKLDRARGEGGFALILALLSLVLLTSLGLTLAASTSTELQIASNQKWAEQARYNAEAGIEFGKRILAILDWNTIVPEPVTAAWNGTPGNYGGATPTFASARPDTYGNPSRNFEGSACDAEGNGRGYGVVLDDGTADGPYQYKTTVGGFALNGAFTLWVRRPRQLVDDVNTGALSQDYDGSDALILVSEGIAPFSSSAVSTMQARRNRASHVMEYLLTKNAIDECATRRGQAALNAQGTNSSGCSPVTETKAGLGASGTGNVLPQ